MSITDLLAYAQANGFGWVTGVIAVSAIISAMLPAKWVPATGPVRAIYTVLNALGQNYLNAKNSVPSAAPPVAPIVVPKS